MEYSYVSTGPSYKRTPEFPSSTRAFPTTPSAKLTFPPGWPILGPITFPSPNKPLASLRSPSKG